MKQDNLKFLYNEMEVTFKRNEEELVYINATQMAKVFGKRPSHWLELESTKNYVKILKKRLFSDSTDDGKDGIANNELIKTVKGGSGEQGTWLHQDLAIKFAGWLDVEFEIWCNERLKEIFKHGFTGTTEKLHELIKSPELVKGLAEEIIRLRDEAEMYKAKTIEQQPKVDYFDNVLVSTSTHNITTIAKELGMSAKALNKILHDKGVQYKQGGVWVLYSKYQAEGFTEFHTYTQETNGISKTYVSTKWTEKGRKFIHDLIKNF